MSDELATVQEALPIDAPPERITESKRYRWFEVILVLLVSFGNSLFGSLFALANGRGLSPYSPDSRWTMGILQELTSLLLLVYVLSRRRMRLGDLGLRWSFGELGTGLAVAVVSYLTYAAGYILVHSLHGVFFSSSTSGLTPLQAFGHPSIIAIPFILLNPFFEELIVRAYLMTEVRNLTGSWTLSAALSILVQFSYHLYYGWERAISVSFLFLVFSIYYARTRKATPIIIAHGVFDILAMARLW
jgi:membrane protease YdiL (CAAX protease family)